MIISTHLRRRRRHLSFSSLPDDLIVSILARIPRSYYPSLSLVSKSFRSLVSSQELIEMRYHLGTFEKFLCVSIQLPNHSQPSWFSLWINKPNQTLTMNMQNPTGNYLIPIPSSSYIPRVPGLSVTDGSISYAIGERGDTPLPLIWVRYNPNDIWHEVPSMPTPRSRAMNAHATILDDNLYVMGGYNKDDDESAKNWGEIFDLKSQTWEPLTDPPCEKLSFSLIKHVWACNGKLFVIMIISEKIKELYVYDPKERKWDSRTNPISSLSIWLKEKMVYVCYHNHCLWYDFKIGNWRMVMGLDLLKGYDMVEIIHYGGKLVVFLEDNKLGQQSDEGNKSIWCAVVALERRNISEIWGQIEWNDIVLTVPQTSTFLSYEVAIF